jgi:hypothetical protein
LDDLLVLLLVESLSFGDADSREFSGRIRMATMMPSSPPVEEGGGAAVLVLVVVDVVVAPPLLFDISEELSIVDIVKKKTDLCSLFVFV